ncbi:MAG: DUF2059 domain-containing protein [Alphaproteobacteria bacterium]|nr:DUF2059 domain-containing protein [Alphaproteobacteria bacterium]
MKKIIIACLIATLAFPAYAGKDEKVKELVALFQLDAIGSEVDRQIMDPIDCSFVMTEAEKTIVTRQVKNILDVNDTVIRVAKDFYGKNFTEAEIDEILAFYKTPVGKKTITLLPKVSQTINETMISYMKKVSPQMETLVQDLKKKYKTRSQVEMQACMTRKARR